MIVDYSGAMRDYFQGANTWAKVFFFEGIEPTKLSEIPFDINDPHAVFNACVGVSYVQKFTNNAGQNYGYKHVAGSVARKGAGYRQNGDGVLRAIPDTVTFSHVDENRTTNGCQLEYIGNMFSTDDNGHSEYGGIIRPIDASIPVYIEMEFDEPVKANGINIKTYTSPGYQRAMDVEYWDGSAWVKLTGFTSAEISNFDTLTTDDPGGLHFPFSEVTASKFRLAMPDNSAANGGNDIAYQYLRNIHFTLSEVPAGQNIGTITWALMIHKDKALIDGELLAYIMDVGDARDAGKGMTISNKNPQPQEPIRVAYCKFDFNMMET